MQIYLYLADIKTYLSVLCKREIMRLENKHYKSDGSGANIMETVGYRREMAFHFIDSSRYLSILITALRKCLITNSKIRR